MRRNSSEPIGIFLPSAPLTFNIPKARATQHSTACCRNDNHQSVEDKLYHAIAQGKVRLQQTHKVPEFNATEAQKALAAFVHDCETNLIAFIPVAKR